MALSNKITRYFCIIWLLCWFGCVKYSFKGALPSYLKTISIPLFKDRSAWVGLQERFSQKVIEAFVQDNTLKVVEGEKEVDLLLKGTIISVMNRKTSITPGELVEEEQMVVTVQVECSNEHTQKPLWSGSISNFGVVPGDAGLQQRDEAVNTAVDKIILEILNRTIAAW